MGANMNKLTDAERDILARLVARCDEPELLHLQDMVRGLLEGRRARAATEVLIANVDAALGIRRCDCGNPECQLPPGRCLRCGQPCEAEHPFVVCGDCQPLLQELWKREAAAAPQDRCDGCTGCPGWAPFNLASDGSVEVQRCDTCKVFDSDDAAAEHVQTHVAAP